MARYTGPVCRLCRREKMKLFLKGARCDTMKCAIEKRPYPPGDHGRTQLRRKDSEYLTQLRKGDVVALRDKAKAMIVIRHNLDIIDRAIPPWLEAVGDKSSVTVRDLPMREHIDVPVREQLIVELYSK